MAWLWVVLSVLFLPTCSCLHNCPSAFKPLLYRRHVDYFFFLFKSFDHVPLFLNNLNHQHSNISFTSELEKDCKRPFLYIEISPSNSKFSTSVFRKSTFTGLFTQFHSFIPLAYKRPLVSGLLHRIFNLCSNYENFHAQLEVVRKLFNMNGFPSHMLDQVVRRFFNHIFEPKPNVHTVPKKMVYFCLPFTVSCTLSLNSNTNHQTL